MHIYDIQEIQKNENSYYNIITYKNIIAFTKVYIK
jgi:hypothetical protein